MNKLGLLWMDGVDSSNFGELSYQFQYSVSEMLLNISEVGVCPNVQLAVSRSGDHECDFFLLLYTFQYFKFLYNRYHLLSNWENRKLNNHSVNKSLLLNFLKIKKN